MTKETIIKSTLKYLVKRQIEEGSVGFAVDNDHDHDCCWDDVLAWIEAQPSEDCIRRQAVIDFIIDNYGVGFNSLTNGIRDYLPSVIPQTTCEDAVSREAVIKTIKEMSNANPSYTHTCDVVDRQDLIDSIDELPSVTPKYTDEEIDKAQAVEQAYVDKMVELAVEEIKERYSDAIGKMKKAIDEMTEIHSDGEFYIKNVDAKWIISKYLCGAELKEASDG